MPRLPSIFERNWPGVVLTPIQVLNHIITVSDTAGLHDKQIITLSKAGFEQVQFEIQRVISDTQLAVVSIGKNSALLANPTDYDGGTLSAAEQLRPAFGSDIALRAAFEEGPAVAFRTIAVDSYGQKIGSVTGIDGINRLAVDAAVSVTGISVDLDALTPPTRPDPDNILIAGSEDGTKGGLKHALRVDSELDLRVGISDGTNKAIVNGTGELAVIDQLTRDKLDIIIAGLLSIDVGIPAALGQTTMANSMPVTIASNQTPIPVVASLSDEPIKISGTSDGTPSGTEYTFVNNLRLQILAAKDRTQAITYADFGTKDQRVTLIDYISPSIGAGPGYTARKSLAYTLVGNKYRRDSITWSMV